MSNSLSEQLLKAGLITQAQIDKAEQAKQQQKEKAKEAKERPRERDKPRPPRNQPPAAKPNAGAKEGSGQPSPAPAGKPAPAAKPAKTKQSSDLEQFYRERDQMERQEKAAEEQRRREVAERKKQTRQQVRDLILANQKNVEDAAVRYNFVVGETVKYLYVTEQQQQELADGLLAITFVDGKRCLIPADVARQVLAIDPDKLVVLNTGGAEEPIPDPLPDSANAADSTGSTDSAT